MDFDDKLAPLRDAFRKRRVAQGWSHREVSARIGMSRTWTAEIETSHPRTANPQIGRLTEWARALDVQEFGVYAVIDGNHLAVPLYDDGTDDDTQDDVEDEVQGSAGQ